MESASIENIDPKLAEKLLKLNTRNFRTVSRSRVNGYAKDMSRGSWKVNGASIVITEDGVLIDGQHRLLAILKSGVTIKMTVVRGVKCDGRTIDKVLRRTIQQALQNDGFKCAKDVATASRLCVSHKKGMWAKKSLNFDDILDSEVYEFAEQNKEGLEEAVRIARPARKILPTSLTASIVFIGSEYVGLDHELPHWFIRSIENGVDLSNEDGVLHLRNKILNQKHTSQIHRSMKRWLATIAWNKAVLQDPCSPRALAVAMVGPRKSNPPNCIEVIPE